MTPASSGGNGHCVHVERSLLSSALKDYDERKDTAKVDMVSSLPVCLLILRTSITYWKYSCLRSRNARCVHVSVCVCERRKLVFLMFRPA